MNRSVFLLFLILNLSLIITDDIFSAQRPKYLWGTYKPNLYFSLKNKENPSIVVGVMWFGANTTTDYINQIRHNCNQSDNLLLRWKYHDGSTYGKQIIVDNLNNLNLETSFIKTNYTQESQTWISSIYGNSTDQNPLPGISVIIYAALEGFDEGSNELNYLEYEQNTIHGFINGVKNFSLNLNFTGKLQSSATYQKKFINTWQVKQFFANNLQSDNILNSNSENPNIIGIQIYFENEVDVSLGFNQAQNPEIIPVDRNSFLDLEKSKIAAFQKKYQFIYETKSVNLKFLSPDLDNSIKRFSIEALSNLIGGIGYFYGQQEVQGGLKDPLNTPKGLFTCTPSRPIFPRGFMWDEGFHEILIYKWDPILSMQILHSWLETEFSNGWIPREQVRGLEAREYVPAWAVEAVPNAANPPTLIFILNSFAEDYDKNSISDTPEAQEVLGLLPAFMKSIYPKISKNYEWFNTTQICKVNGSFFTWQAMTPNAALASGFDDLPRGHNINIEMKHLDLQVWMIEFTQFMMRISKILKDDQMSEVYQNRSIDLINAMREGLFNPQLQILSDYEGPQIVNGTWQNIYSPDISYINLLPFAFGLLNQTDIAFTNVLNVISDPNILFSNYGLRGISASDYYYHRTSNYWRGNVWININYLTLRGIYKFYNDNEVAMEIYNKIRTNMINCVYDQWKLDKLFYEHYYDQYLAGQGAHPFNGWTSTIMNIVSEKYH